MLRIACRAVVGLAGDVPGEPFFAGLQEILRPLVIEALGNPFLPAQLRNAFFAAQTVQHNADLLLGAILLTGLTFDVFDDALAGCLSCLSHSSLHEDEDEPKVSLSLDPNLCHGR